MVGIRILRNTQLYNQDCLLYGLYRVTLRELQLENHQLVCRSPVHAETEKMLFRMRTPKFVRPCLDEQSVGIETDRNTALVSASAPKEGWCCVSAIFRFRPMVSY